MLAAARLVSQSPMSFPQLLTMPLPALMLPALLLLVLCSRQAHQACAEDLL